jgi:hypothetical protein
MAAVCHFLQPLRLNSKSVAQSVRRLTLWAICIIDPEALAALSVMEEIRPIRKVVTPSQSSTSSRTAVTNNGPGSAFKFNYRFATYVCGTAMKGQRWLKTTEWEANLKTTAVFCVPLNADILQYFCELIKMWEIHDTVFFQTLFFYMMISRIINK